MYNPFRKGTPPVKPNAWDAAVYQAVTCSPAGNLPTPKTRIEQLAQEFVCAVIDGKDRGKRFHNRLRPRVISR